MLVVDDEHDVADTQALKLGERYETTVAYSGQQRSTLPARSSTLCCSTDECPTYTVTIVLSRLRERGYDGIIIVLTAVDADLNILEMPFDDYLQNLSASRRSCRRSINISTDPTRTMARRVLPDFLEALCAGTRKVPSQLESSAEYTELKNVPGN